MLTLVGLGLVDERDLSLKGLKAIKEADKVFLENYTSQWKGREGLENLTNKKIERVERSDLEEEMERILDLSEDKDVSVLIPGDPLVATTHVELLLQAKKRGIETKIVHSSSIYSAIAETGLQIYKFGKTTTLPIPQKNYRPGSPYQVIKENKERGLHTMALLDIKDRPMEVSEALEYLLEMEEEKQSGVISEDTKAVAFNIDEEGTNMTYKKVSELLETDFPTPAVLILPSELHEKEEEALEAFSEDIA